MHGDYDDENVQYRGTNKNSNVNPSTLAAEPQIQMM